MDIPGRWIKGVWNLFKICEIYSQQKKKPAADTAELDSKLKAVRCEKKRVFPRQRPRNNKNINKPYQGHRQASVNQFLASNLWATIAGHCHWNPCRAKWNTTQSIFGNRRGSPSWNWSWSWQLLGPGLAHGGKTSSTESGLGPLHNRVTLESLTNWPGLLKRKCRA